MIAAKCMISAKGDAGLLRGGDTKRRFHPAPTSVTSP
jgi:hypothetical protein